MKITTNKLEYQFKYDELNEKYSGAVVQVPDKNDFTEFHKLLENDDVISYTFIKFQYFLLLLKKDSTLCYTWDGKLKLDSIRFSPKVSLPQKITLYKNHFFQLLLNQLTDGDDLLPAKNLSSDLIITKSNWIKDIENFPKQIFGLQFQIGWDQTLSCNVVTYTATSKTDSDYDFYEFDNKRNIIRRNICKTSLELFEKNNILKRNEVEFVLLDDKSNFDESKIGVISKVIKNLEKHFGQLFEGGKIDFVNEPVIQFFNGKLPMTLPGRKDNKRTWHDFFGETINIYCSGQDKVSTELFGMIYDLFMESEELESYGLNFQRNNKSVEGLNIQVIRDARNNKEVKEEYELGTNKKWIQHITPDGLGKLNRNNKIQFHKIEDKDISTNPSVINTFENLFLKKQIAQKQMINIDPKLLDICSEYSFYYFEWVKKAVIKVTKLDIDKAGHMDFEQENIQLFKNNEETESEKLCFSILSKFGIKGDVRFIKSVWGSIEYAVKVGSDYIAVRNSDKQVFPNMELLPEKQAHADASKRLKICEVISNVEYLSENSNDAKYQKAAEMMISIMEENFDSDPDAVRVSVGEIKSKLKENKISFRKKAVSSICRDLEESYSYTFNNSSRQAKEIDLFVGFSGMGLVSENGRYYYFVGSTNKVQQKITRATRLRQIVAIIADDTKITEEKLIEDNFDNFMLLMNVGFVKIGQYTVNPFPIKYIREYCDHHYRKANLKKK
ncbi:hypothetical protein [Companilactobacillus zhongbaensis]|uniref:hypothetical protein n=1 Tax=Companilactobacillus zhongbaensis TaxID=2486009 RepID=UPI000F7893C1|nr:hypothetical protein [Companilactobacillus zhongbaensis]